MYIHTVLLGNQGSRLTEVKLPRYDFFLKFFLDASFFKNKSSFRDAKTGSIFSLFHSHDNRVGIIILFVFLESCYPLEHSRSDTSLGNGKDSNADD